MAKENDLRSGQTGMLLLRLLTDADLYGYELLLELRDRSGGVFDLKGGTLYPLLRRLEESGWITSYEAVAGAGRMRRYYHLTDEGRSALAKQSAEWKRYAYTVYQVLGAEYGG